MLRRRNKEHWVCFDCRKMFRKPSRWEGVAPGREPPAPKHECPECKQEMRDMGTYFEPPRLQNKRAWEVMRILADSGFTFHSEGSKAFAEAFILGRGRPNPKEVRARVAEFQRAEHT